MGSIHVHASKRFFVKDDRPFFYLADTAWNLAQHLTREEAEDFLTIRSRQGFNAVMFTLIPENAAFTTPNRDGHFPLHHQDPTQPNEAWFAHIDWLIETCHAKGITPALLPSWGCYWNNLWAPDVPMIFTPENARIYGEYLGRRYAGKEISWIIGGDRPVSKYDQILILRNMAEGIKSQGADQLMGLHTPGWSSSYDHGGQEAWLDYNGWQSGHMTNALGSDDWADREYNRAWVRPILEMEPAYENHPMMQEGWVPSGNRFDDWRVRRDLYTSVLAGSCGHTYGCNDIWQFHDDAVHPSITGSNLHWREAAELPGANQVGPARTIFEQIGFESFVPAQSRILEGIGEGLLRARCAVGASHVAVYAPTARTLKIDWSGLEIEPEFAFWFDTVSGERASARLGESIDVPGEGVWLLVVPHIGRPHASHATQRNG